MGSATRLFEAAASLVGCTDCSLRAVAQRESMEVAVLVALLRNRQILRTCCSIGPHHHPEHKQKSAGLSESELYGDISAHEEGRSFEALSRRLKSYEEAFRQRRCPLDLLACFQYPREFHLYPQPPLDEQNARKAAVNSRARTSVAALLCCHIGTFGIPELGMIAQLWWLTRELAAFADPGLPPGEDSRWWVGGRPGLS